MSKPKRTWEGDWRRKIISRIQATGSETVTDFLAKSPTDSYVDVAASLGDDVAALQIERMQFEEAKNECDIRMAAMDSLVREMAFHLPDGWRHGAKGDFDTASVYADWIVRLEQKQANLKSKGKAVWEALKASMPQVGWSPKGIDDVYIVDAFSKGWPNA